MVVERQLGDAVPRAQDEQQRRVEAVAVEDGEALEDGVGILGQEVLP